MARKRDEIRRLNLPSPEREKWFDLVYRRYFQKLYAYSSVICNSRDLAEDIVSDVFYDLLKNQTDLTMVKDLEAYLFVAVRNKSVKALLQNYKWSSLEDTDVIYHVVDRIDPEALLLERELKETLDKIVNKLPGQCQLIFRMAKEKGLKYSEIAEELGISKENVKMQLKRAQSKIRKGIFEFYHEKAIDSFPDVRLIGQVVLFAALPYIDILH